MFQFVVSIFKKKNRKETKYQKNYKFKKNYSYPTLDIESLKYNDIIDYSNSNQKNFFYKKQNKLISRNELRFYWALKKALPTHKHLIINCQTPVLSLLKPENEIALRKIWSKRVDFTITNSDFETLAIIELDDASHKKKERIERDEFINYIFEESEHHLIRFKTRKFYDPENIRTVLSYNTTIYN